MSRRKTPPEFMAYIEGKFTAGMSWSNYGEGGWWLDHIIPCSSFDLTNPEELKRCWHYTNLQPMWWMDNIKKGTKITLAILSSP